MTLNLRPKGDPTAPCYAPHRDLANIFAPMMQEVYFAFAETNWPAHYKSWIEAEGLTEADFASGAEKFSEAVALFIREPDIQNPHDAFVRSGFFDLPAPVRTLYFARIGEVITGGFFVAFRDVTLQGFKSSIHDDFLNMLAAGKALAQQLRELEGGQPVSDEASVDRHNRMLPIALQEQIDELNRTLDQSNRAREAAVSTLATTQMAAERLTEIGREATDKACRFQQLQHMPWKIRLKLATRYLFSGKIEP